MSDSESDGQKPTRTPRKRWSFPRAPIARVEFVIATIVEHGSGEKMRRVNLLDKSGRKDSGPTREALTVSAQYGLTRGNSAAAFIEPTELGLRFANRQSRRAALVDIIEAVEAFRSFHERFADRRVLAPNLMVDWAIEVGVDSGDADTFVEVLVANAHEAGLIQQLSGSDTFVSFDHAREVLAGPLTTTVDTSEPPALLAPGPSPAPPGVGGPSSAGALLRPEIHIDIQIHIAAESGEEQIDKIFESMAKHLGSLMRSNG